MLELSLETRGVWGILATISHHFPFQKANERQLPELNRLSAANPTFPERPRSLQGLLLKCEAATVQHTGGEADPALV